jgi:hypothetical protein
VHFLHNKINTAIGRPEISREEADTAYWMHYVPKEAVDHSARRKKRILGAAAILAALLITAGGLAVRGNILEL